MHVQYVIREYATMDTSMEVKPFDGVPKCSWLLFSVVAINDEGNSTASINDTIPPCEFVYDAYPVSVKVKAIIRIGVYIIFGYVFGLKM